MMAPPLVSFFPMSLLQWIERLERLERLALRRCPLLFRPRCACATHPRHRGVLRLTGLLFLLPAGLLLAPLPPPLPPLPASAGSTRLYLPLGTACVILALTSLAYHGGHRPWVRALDLLCLCGTAALCLSCVVVWWGRSPAWDGLLLAALVPPLLSAVVARHPSCQRRTQESDGSHSVLALEWHVFVHVVNVVGICLLGLYSRVSEGRIRFDEGERGGEEGGAGPGGSS